MNKLLILTVLATAALGMTAVADSTPFDLTTTLGETYHGCRIIKATPEALTVAHDDGVAKVPFTILGDEWREKFHYSPSKARQFKLDEERRLAKAEVKRKEVQKEYEKSQTKLMNELSQMEKKRAELAAKLASEQATAAAVSGVAQPGSLLPFPGDVTSQIGTVTVIDGSGIPITAPVGTPYTPGLTNGQRFIINQGSVFTPGDGSLYYINPGYGYPGYGYPGYVYPPVIVQPRIVPRGGVQQGGSVIIGNGGATGAVNGGSVIIRRK